MFGSNQQTTTNIPCSFAVCCKYEVMEAMGAMEGGHGGDGTGGQH